MSYYKPQYTAVIVGRNPGVYANWQEARKQTDNFPGAVWKSFPSHFAAAGYLKTESRKRGVNPTFVERKTSEIVTGRKPLAPKRSLVSLSDDEDEEPIMKNGRWSYPEEELGPLSPQQQEVLDRIMKGENVFFTGAAGTGKSHLFRAIIKALRGRGGGGKKVAVTASTGMAALNVGGSTLHSWARIGLGTRPVPDLVRSIWKQKGAVDAWRKTDALLVDEISMISAELLDKLDQIGKQIRGGSRPFGGIQLVFCGDFFQLPPVQDRQGPTVKYAFDAAIWDRAFPRANMVTLGQVFRQAEANLVTALEQIRQGTISVEANALLAKCNRPVECPEGTRPVQLYSRRFQVEQVNNENLAALPGQSHVFKAIDIPGKTSSGFNVSQEQATRTLNNSTRWPENVTLKVGAQVMLVHGLVNGSTGKVVRFSTMADFDGGAGAELEDEPRDSKQMYPVVDFEARNGLKLPPVLVPVLDVKVENALGKMEAQRVQVPLILAWAITIHKAQGMTLNRVKVDLQGTFDVGQAYVAISRATTLEGLELRGFNSRHIMVSPRVLQWAEEQAEDDEFDDWFMENAAELDAHLSSQPIVSEA